MENTPEEQGEEKEVKQETNIKKWAIIAIVVVVVLVFFKIVVSPEKMTERALERATDGAYDVDIDEDGSMQITGGEGEEMNITSGKNATLPDEWPSSVPLLPDATIEYAAAVRDGDGGVTLTVTYITDQAVSEVVGYYETELIDNGWTIEATMNVAGSLMISASNDNDEEVVLNVSESEGATTVIISTQLGE